MNIGRWKVPEKLFEQYIKFRMLADGYLSKTIKTPGEEMGIKSPSNDMERTMRWQICVKKVMETHREICKAINVEYTTDDTDEFYIALQKEVRKQLKLKG